jgi:hypothetical protein
MTIVPSRRDFLGGVAGLAALPVIGLAARDMDDAQARDTPMRDLMLVFDTFGTVVDWRGTIVAEGADLSRRKGLDVDWAAFADAWRAEYRPSMERVRRGDLPWTATSAC